MLKQSSLIFMTCLISSSVCCESFNHWQDNCKSNYCEAIIDAGSSGSRLYIYAKTDHQWKVLYNHQVSPGLSSTSVQNIGPYLEKLVNIHPDKPMPILLYGTAGMRLLPDDEQSQRYQAAVGWFNQHPEWTLKQARTISGQEEGVFAWLAVQEERGLINKSLENLDSVVEIGGASAQVSIPVSEQEAKLLPAADVYALKWNQKIIHIWSKSFLGLGLNEVEKKFSDNHACFSSGYPLKNGSTGQGDMGMCVAQLEQQSDIDLLGKLNQAKEIVKKHPQGHWVALGAIRFSAAKPPYSFVDQAFSLKQLKQQGDDELCHQDWGVLNSVFKNDPYLYRGCLAASYFYSYLEDGIGISENDKIFYPDAKAQMDWTLGALLLG